MDTNKQLISNTALSIMPSDDGDYDYLARHHLGSLMTPSGALGKIGEIAVKLSMIQRTVTPSVENKVLIISCASHGVVAQDVSSVKHDITNKIVRQFIRGKTAVNAFCLQANVPPNIFDLGIKDFGLEYQDGVIGHSLGEGTDDITLGPAMTRDQCYIAMAKGITEANIYADCHLNKPDLVCLGEMGIGNTTASSAIFSAITVSSQLSGVGVPSDIRCVPDGTRVRALLMAERHLRRHRRPVEVRDV